MSRIDEALRKAMEGDRPSDVRTVAEELDALANEAIPEEMPEPIHARPAQVHHFAYAVPVARPGPLSLVPPAPPAGADKPLMVRQLSEHLALLPAGVPSADPMAGLTSPRMARLIAEAREMFDWVIIDTPPLGLLPDANLLGSLADGAIIIVAAGST